jgi:hypothetical protein
MMAPDSEGDDSGFNDDCPPEVMAPASEGDDSGFNDNVIHNS